VIISVEDRNGNEKKNEKENFRSKEEVDYDFGRICNINKYYKQINEAIITFNNIEDDPENTGVEV
jgi:hypothetical protein